MSKLEAVFDDYYVASPAPTVGPAADETPTASERIQAKVQGRKNKDFETVNPRDELKAYLAALLGKIEDVVAWWGTTLPSTLQWPASQEIISRFKALRPHPEGAFSNVSLTGTPHRNRLAANMFEALRLLKSAYRNGRMLGSGSLKL
ncbi:hypothetical protein K438DRAFT_1986049 [Mycena galopus ATCC 62051]|nr:hypothetical protein K438DRAFT_1986049 [Mycena galopus ATCC 62051]